MFDINKIQKGSYTNYTKGNEYHKASEVKQGVPYEVTALFINDSKYGESLTIATKDFNIFAPKHVMKTVKPYIDDNDFVETVNRGLLRATVREYDTDKYTIDFTYAK